MRANMKFIGHLFLRQLLSAKAGNFETRRGKMTKNTAVRVSLLIVSSSLQHHDQGC